MSEARFFEIPSTWRWAPLGEIADVKLGKMLSEKAFGKDLIQLPYLRNQNVRWASIDYSDIKLMGFKESELERYSLKPGDLLVCEGGEPGRCALYTRGAGEFMYQKALHRIRPYADILPKYLQLCLWNYVFNGLVIPRPSETTIQHLPLERMLELSIPVAPQIEQEKIVAEIEKQFTRLDAAVNSLRRARKALKHYRASILRAACEGRLVPTEAELARVEGRKYESADLFLALIDKTSEAPAKLKGTNLQELPEGWSWRNLSQLAWDASYGTSQKCGYGAAGPPVLRIPNVVKNSIDTSNRKNAMTSEKLITKAALEPGDFLVIRTNGSKELIGHGALVRSTFLEPTYFASYLIRFRLIRESGLHEWIAAIWSSPFMRSAIMGLSTTSAGQYNVSLSSLSELSIPIPPRIEIRRIINELERQLSIIAQVEEAVAREIDRADQLRSAILKRAFEGSLVPHDPADQSAAILLERIRKSREGTIDSRPRRGRGIKPGVSTPGPEAQPDPQSQRDGGSVRQSPSAPSGLGGDFETPSLGLKPHALSPGPVGAKTSDGDSSALLELSADRQARVIWEHLVGMGPLRQDDAIRTVAGFLRYEGLVNREYVRTDSMLWRAIAAAIDLGVEKGLFDRPGPGEVRACLPDARSYSLELWSLCLLVSMEFGKVDEDQALRAAAEEARKRMGLKFERLPSDGVILQGLGEALEDEVRQGHLRRQDGKVWLTPVKELEDLMDSEWEPQIP